jgi:thymidylate synthase (FAD)
MPRYVEPETRIAQCARISFDNFHQEHRIKEDQALVRYLYENQHTSPLEMVEFMFEIHCPQFVATHFHRHRTASINEISQRYKEIPDEYYSPDIRRQSITNKQGSIRDEELANAMLDKVEKMNHRVDKLLEGYHELIKAGVAKEVSRSYLPRSMYTTMVYKMDANNLLKFLSLRCAPDAQYETQVYANAMKQLVSPLIPTLIKCLDERLNSIILRPDEIKAMACNASTLGESVRRNKEYQTKYHRLRPKKLFILLSSDETLAQSLIDNTRPSYWMTFKLPRCINGMKVSMYEQWDSDHDIIVTDCKTQCELDSLKQLDYELVTIRTVKSSDPITFSELNNLRTDYLLVDSPTSLNFALELFPQYRD